MKTLSLASVLFTLLGLSFSHTFAQAPADKINVRVMPKPNQTAQYKLTQEVTMEMSSEGEAAPQTAFTKPMQMTMNSVMTFTQKNGVVDKQGRLLVELTYDKITSEMTMNGQAMPLDTGNKLSGQTIKMIYDQQGNLVDVTAPVDTPLPKESFQEFLKSIYGYLPTAPMAIGETSSLPLKQALPLPVPGGAPLVMEGTMQIKLAAVTKEGNDRIAKFEQTTDAKMANVMEMPGPDGEKMKMSMDFKMSGGGSSTLNLDQGLVKSGESLMKMEGKITMSEVGGNKMPNRLLQGTIKTTVSGGN